jgi:putative transposase
LIPWLDPKATSPRPSGRSSARVWSKRTLAGKHYVYVRADGMHSKVRLEEGRQCNLVLLGGEGGADRHRRRLPGERAVLEGTAARREVPWPGGRAGPGQRRRGVGFLEGDPPGLAPTGAQRCWVHKTANVLGKLHEGSRPKAKGMPHDIYRADGRAKAFSLTVKTYRASYPKATECLDNDRGGVADLLRLPGGAQDVRPDHQPDRVDVLDGPASARRV